MSELPPPRRKALGRLMTKPKIGRTTIAVRNEVVEPIRLAVEQIKAAAVMAGGARPSTGQVILDALKLYQSCAAEAAKKDGKP